MGKPYGESTLWASFYGRIDFILDAFCQVEGFFIKKIDLLTMTGHH
jgi:hypothetical protein